MWNWVQGSVIQMKVCLVFHSAHCILWEKASGWKFWDEAERRAKKGKEKKSPHPRYGGPQSNLCFYSFLRDEGFPLLSPLYVNDFHSLPRKQKVRAAFGTIWYWGQNLPTIQPLSGPALHGQEPYGGEIHSHGKKMCTPRIPVAPNLFLPAFPTHCCDLWWTFFCYCTILTDMPTQFVAFLVACGIGLVSIQKPQSVLSLVWFWSWI